MTSQGSAHGRFTRAIQQRNLFAAEIAAREVPRLSLEDALALTALRAETDGGRYEQAAVRWHGRFELEARLLTLAESQLALAALMTLPGPASDHGRQVLAEPWPPASTRARSRLAARVVRLRAFGKAFAARFIAVVCGYERARTTPSMRRRLALFFAIAAAAFGAGTATPSAARSASSVPMKTCSAKFVHAVIGGKEDCLHAGEYCAQRFDRQYRRYGFQCTHRDRKGRYRLTEI